MISIPLFLFIYTIAMLILLLQGMLLIVGLIFDWEDFTMCIAKILAVTGSLWLLFEIFLILTV